MRESDDRSTWSEVRRVTEEFIEQGMLSDETEEKVKALLDDGKPREALDLAVESTDPPYKE